MNDTENNVFKGMPEFKNVVKFSQWIFSSLLQWKVGVYISVYVHKIPELLIQKSHHKSESSNTHQCFLQSFWH